MSYNIRKIIEADFNKYLKIFYENGLPAKVENEFRRIFYSGIALMFQEILEIYNENNVNNAVIKFEEIRKELERFCTTQLKDEKKKYEKKTSGNS